MWDDLAGDARRADEAIRILSGAPGRSVPFLKERLRPAEAVPPQRLRQLIADLDSDTYAVRTGAFQELVDLAEQAEPAMRTALEGKPSLEVRRRIEQIRNDVRQAIPSANRLRQLRALACLEGAGTPEARELLASLSRGAPEARLTCEARAALQRLARK